MKRRSISLVCLLVVLSTAGCIEFFPVNLFPSIHRDLRNGIGQGTQGFQMFQGWYLGNLAWFIAWDSSNLKPTLRSRLFFFLSDDFAASRQRVGQNNFIVDHKAVPSPEPKLLSAIDHGAPLVYIVTNFQQGPLFTSAPGNADYSGLWREAWITWKPGAVRRPIISELDLPGPVEADIVLRNVVVNWPTVALGPLGGPWFPAPPGSYRLKQVADYDQYRKTVELPTWAAFGRDPVHRTILQVEVAITDVSDPLLAELLQANYAPGLNDVPQSDTQRLWILDWTQTPAPPPGQLPVLENVLRNLDIRGRPNANYDYSCVMQLVLLERNTLPAYVVLNNPEFIKSQLPPSGTGLGIENDDHRFNVLMLASRKWTNNPSMPIFDDHD